jgi:tetratricopeptide (TPR) repeat protein
MIPFAGCPKRLFVNRRPRGLPPRIYLPFVLVFSALFLGTMGYLVAVGFGVGGSVFGASVTTTNSQSAQQRVEGGPPPAVMLEWQSLQRRVARHPRDDVALTQLGDLELTANRFDAAIGYYRRALAVDPKNPAAQEGLAEAQQGLRESQ